MEKKRALLFYKEDRFNLVRLLTAPLIFAVGVLSAEIWLIVLVWLLLDDINFLLHQHVHHPLTRSRILNKTIDILAGIVTGMSAANWRLQHIDSHHNGNYSAGEGTRWEFEQPTFTRGLIHAVRTIPHIYLGTLWHALYHGYILNDTRLPYKTNFLEQLFVLAVVVSVCIYNPYFIFWYLLVAIITKRVDHLNHAGAQSILSTNSNVNPAYNNLRDNFGFHAAHHSDHTAHWTRLPEIHAQLVARGEMWDVTDNPYTWPGKMNVVVLVRYALLKFRE